jgi:hypothetical protein
LGLFEIACGDDQIECSSYTSARMVVHMFGFLTCIVAFNYHVAYLTAHLRESSIASMETAKMYIRLSQFSNLRILFLLYIVQPTIAVVIRADVLDWVDDWIFLTVFWSSKILLICFLIYIFRPQVMRMPIVDYAIKERRRTQISYLGS